MWTKLDDGYPDHPKILAAGPLAAWLHTCALCYTNRLLTDGFIPIGQVRRLADVADALKLAATLVEVGLWEQAPGGYQIHDFHDYNLAASDAKERRERLHEIRSEIGKKGADARWQNGKTDGNLLSPLLSTVDGKTMPPPPSSHIPLPTTRPDPEEETRERVISPQPKTKAVPKESSTKTTLPKGFEVTDEMYNVARAKYPLLDLDQATEEWRDYCKRDAKKYVDWEAAWRGAMKLAEGWRLDRSKNNGTNRSNGQRQPNRFDTYHAAAESILREAQQIEATDFTLLPGPGTRGTH